MAHQPATMVAGASSCPKSQLRRRNLPALGRTSGTWREDSADSLPPTLSANAECSILLSSQLQVPGRAFGHIVIPTVRLTFQYWCNMQDTLELHVVCFRPLRRLCQPFTSCVCNLASSCSTAWSLVNALPTIWGGVARQMRPFKEKNTQPAWNCRPAPQSFGDSGVEQSLGACTLATSPVIKQGREHRAAWAGQEHRAAWTGRLCTSIKAGATCRTAIMACGPGRLFCSAPGFAAKFGMLGVSKIQSTRICP